MDIPVAHLPFIPVAIPATLITTMHPSVTIPASISPVHSAALSGISPSQISARAAHWYMQTNGVDPA